MSLKFCSLSSGSSGNCYYVTDGSTSLLVDAGISGKKIIEGIEKIDEDKESLAAILVTHEHIDHVKSLKVMGKKVPGLKVYANEDTWHHIEDKVEEERRCTFVPGKEFKVGDINVRSFRTSHDAACSVGFSFYDDERKISIVTDTGYIPEHIYEEIKDADILVIEANHDVNVLAMCSYPYNTKRRIAGDEGHLSNEACGNCIARLVSELPKPRQVLLAHLSKENNSPDLAHLTIKNILEESRLKIGEDLRMDVITRDKVSPVYVVK